ncbi:MAG: hypothetical protein Q8K48_01075 [Candidatus Planktophila sp.]|nr:hypothetical protein [Candidatus Planktophila sp.]
MKTEIVQEIFEKLQALGLDPIRGGASDITVNCQLLDAKSGSGDKSITYENAVLFDEKEKTIFLFEKTAEKSKGFSFGSSSESSFQSGKTLSRHVKGVFIGANGVKIDYDFDIGEISKSIKSIAEMHNLKFKTVIRRKSAEA